MRQSSPAPRSIPAIILAGSRPGVDPLVQAAGVATKALVPVAGQPMVDHVARVLLAHPAVGDVIVMAQNAVTLADHPQTGWLRDDPRVRFVDSGNGISQSLLDWIEGNGGTLPALVTTADNVLIDARILDAFLLGAQGADVAAAMVERAVLMKDFPHSRRTWLKFRGGAWSGANLFWLASPRSVNALRKWREIEQDRKKGWKIISAFGPLLLLGAGLRLLSVHQAIAGAGRRLGAGVARVVPIPIAEACIDADKPDDISLIETIFARRKGERSAQP